MLVEWKRSLDNSVTAPSEFTLLLTSFRNGDKTALDRMTPILYEELRRLARHFLAAERLDHTLQPTALVHEAYLRLVDQHAVDWQNRAHFLGVAASMMRRILINHARANRAAKREGYAQALSLEDALGVFTNPQVDVLELNRALQQLTEIDPQQGRVVELRFFGGLTIEETAEVMGISPATVKREWSTARLWLLQKIEASPLQ
jgi:RNA polymerase sigma-70 factor, ECF subfamily